MAPYPNSAKVVGFLVFLPAFVSFVICLSIVTLKGVDAAKGEANGGSCDSICGMVNYGSQSSPGGTRSPLYYPWAVSIRDNKDERSFCGGVLINKKEVLTAAHCLDGKSKDDIALVLGVFDISRATGTDLYAVKKITVHSGYKKAADNTFENDLALLVLEGEVPAGVPNIRPICLPKEPIDYDENGEVIVLGWGQLSADEKNTAQRLQMLERPAVALSECSRIWQKTFDPAQKICMGRGGHNICKGDEGGPLMAENSRGRQTLVGIVSYSGPTCGDKYPGVYSKFEFYRDWVKKNSLGSSAC